jgi:hypothetical protein
MAKKMRDRCLIADLWISRRLSGIGPAQIARCTLMPSRIHFRTL